MNFSVSLPEIIRNTEVEARDCVLRCGAVVGEGARADFQDTALVCCSARGELSLARCSVQNPAGVGGVEVAARK